MLVALANFMRLSLRKAAHAVVSSATLQEIRVRSGRDDKKERVVVRKGRLLKDRAVGGAAKDAFHRRRTMIGGLLGGCGGGGDVL
jgi:uncharacterized protein YcfJ